MEHPREEGCRSDDSVYPEGSEVCCKGYCLLCRDGRWVDTIVKKESY